MGTGGRILYGEKRLFQLTLLGIQGCGPALAPGELLLMMVLQEWGEGTQGNAGQAHFSRRPFALLGHPLGPKEMTPIPSEGRAASDVSTSSR